MSTVPEVLAALATLGQATLPNAQVINGTITAVTNSSGRLFLVGDEDFEIERVFDSFGGVTTTESYVVPCGVIADVMNTTEQSVADTQVWADYEALEAAIIAAPQLGLVGSFSLQAAVVGTQMTGRDATQNGRHAQVRFGVEVFATSN